MRSGGGSSGCVVMQGFVEALHDYSHVVGEGDRKQ